MYCEAGVVTPFSHFFNHGSSVWPSIQRKTENYPYPHGRKAQNKTYESQGKEVIFLLSITFKSATLRCAAASPLAASSAAKGSISHRAGHLSERGFKSVPFLLGTSSTSERLQQKASLIWLIPCDGVLFVAKASRDITAIHVNAKGPVVTANFLLDEYSLCKGYEKGWKQYRKDWRLKGKRQMKSRIQKVLEPLQ